MENLHKLLAKRKDLVGISVHRPSNIRQHEASSRTNEQFFSESVFESSDLTTDRRLGKM